MSKSRKRYQLTFMKGKYSETICLTTDEEVEYYKKKYKKNNYIFVNLKEI